MPNQFAVIVLASTVKQQALRRKAPYFSRDTVPLTLFKKNTILA